MNNNRGNNRRRGRGNNRAQGGGQQLNRIDSRARGNAPQLLEKYRKMAHDAHLNGDRVQEEYYLQFADHYFRVIADTRVRQDEQRQRNAGGQDRWQDTDEEFDGEAETSQPYETRREREQRTEREQRNERNDRGERREREDVRAEQGSLAIEGEPIESGGDNPFVRDMRAARPRGERRPRREAERSAGPERDDAGEADGNGLDPASLPPAFGPRDEVVVEAAPPSEAVAEAPPAPKRRGRPRKVAPQSEAAAEPVES